MLVRHPLYESHPSMPSPVRVSDTVTVLTRSTLRALWAAEDWFNLRREEVQARLETFGATLCGDAAQGFLEPAGDRKPVSELPLRQLALMDVCMRLERLPAELDWSDPGVLGVLDESVRLGCAWEAHYEALLQRHQPQTVVYNQGRVLHAAVLRHLAVKNGLRALALENTMDRDRLLWDDVSGSTVIHNLGRSWFERLAGLLDDGRCRAHAEEYLAGIGARKSDEHSSPAAVCNDPAASGRFVLFLGQVYTDSSVVFGLSGFRNPIEVIRATTDACARSGTPVIAKLHPKEASGTNPLGMPYARLTARRIEQDPVLAAHLESGRLVVDADNLWDTHDLIARSAACATINSQAGLEAAILGRPVVVAGSAFYGGLGFTSDCTGPAEVSASIECLLSSPSPSSERSSARLQAQRFFYAYLQGYCVPRNEQAVAELILGRTMRPVSPKAERWLPVPAPHCLGPGEELGDFFLEILKAQRPVRCFSEAPVSRTDIEALLDAAIHTCDVAGAHNQRFVVLTEPDEIRRLVRRSPLRRRERSGDPIWEWRRSTEVVNGVPIVIAVFADTAVHDPRGRVPFRVRKRRGIQAGAAAVQNLLVEATARGLGTCWISAADLATSRQLWTGRSWREAFSGYSIPRSWRLQALVSVGHPTPENEASGLREDLEQGNRSTAALDGVVLARETKPTRS